MTSLQALILKCRQDGNHAMLKRLLDTQKRIESAGNDPSLPKDYRQREVKK